MPFAFTSRRLWQSFPDELFPSCRKPKRRAAWRSRFCRLFVEVLEERLAPATLNWTNPNGGNWNQASNWSGGVVPGSGDDAVISTSAAATITIQPSDNFVVHSLTTAANDTLAIAGGSLTVNSSSTLSGGLTMTGGSLTASGSGVSVVVDGTTSVSGANLYAQGGATLSLPELTSYSTANGNTF
jgi:hypothetical protein